ncbi:asparaginase [Inquilinus sp. CAU 1745]|uniref:asparaginase n=1 Tax=Inquilinus sp. CAU 1745 TaxID=3140369 RepID=UPI00325AA542
MSHHHPLDPTNDNRAAASGRADLRREGDPIVVEVTRGPIVESRHRGIAVIADAHGRVQGHWGDLGRSIYPRSAIKSLQALPLVESGAADAFSVSEEELALSCSSHNGEKVHTKSVAAWLDRMGLSADDLECGAQIPYDSATAEALVRDGVPTSALHNNCSGKHAGFLAVAKHLGEPTGGYVRFDHPVQQRILGILEQMTGQELGDAPWGVDGCSIPTVAVPLGGLAVAMARLADPEDLPEKRAEAAVRLRTAWGKHPYLIAGRDRFDTAVMKAGQGRFMVKAGAEGVSCAVLPEQGLGIAVKIEDGAERAASVAMAALLRHVGALDDAGWASLGDAGHPVLKNRRGLEVGQVRAADGFPG